MLKHAGWLLICVAVIALSALVTSPAQAIGAEGWCVSMGGTWSESDATHATCLFLPGSAGEIEYEAECPGASSVVINWVLDLGSWTQTGVECVAATVGVDGGAAPPYGPYGNEVTDPSDITLCLGGNLNGCVTFVGDQHVNKCTISPMLPVGPASSLPEGTVATLYIRLPGDQGSDTHTVCFSTEGIENPVLYQYIAGQWVIVNNGGYGSQICATHNGDGSFALGEAQ